MTTISTTDDLLRAARENAEFREAFRREILTEELLELPQRFAEYAAATDARLDRIEAIVAENSKGIAALVENTNATNLRLDSLETKFDRMQADMGDMKGLLIEHIVREDATQAVFDMSLSPVHILSRREVMAMWQEAHHAGLTESISRGNRRSFIRADLVMEALDENGDTCYIAVEASYVAHWRDLERAKRNAQYITRFTQKPTYAAVASVLLHEEVEEDITQSDPLPFVGQLDYKTFWSELEQPTPN